MKYILTLQVVTMLMACNRNNNCSDLPTSIKSMNEASTRIESSNFLFSETINDTESSWIEEALFYSCDGQKGYFLMNTESRNYIHQEVPLEVWTDFKISASKGRFYNSYLKGNYQFKL